MFTILFQVEFEHFDVFSPILDQGGMVSLWGSAASEHREPGSQAICASHVAVNHRGAYAEI